MILWLMMKKIFRKEEEVIRLLRVDHRLLHGQVAFSWTNSLQADCILIASDKVVKDDVWKTTLKLAKPQGVKLVIKSISDSMEAINSGVTDKYNLIIVVSNIKDAYDLIKSCPIFKSVNLGGTKMIEGYQQISKQIFASKEEIILLNELIDDGIEVEVRQLANESKQIISSKIE